MNKIPQPRAILAALFALAVSVGSAQAQLARTFVSSFGSDLNDCNRLTPCRTFQRAHNNTLANGEITVLDAGGYGAVTINRNISIINDGVGEAGVLVSGGGTGITINAGADDAVSLRGLTVKGLGSAWGGGNGIVFNSGRSLTIENCAIRNMTQAGTPSKGYGIRFIPSTSSNLVVSNTLLSDNVEATAILVAPTGVGTVRVDLNRVELYKNYSGLVADGAGSTGTINVTVVDSVAAAGTGGVGFGVSSSSAAAKLLLNHSVSSNNLFYGLYAVGAAASLRFGRSGITGNEITYGASSGATLQSFGDNYIVFNNDGDPGPPTIGTK